jgi:TonB dependent receptor/Carboxypeptidase regulatory-like domain
VGVAIASFVITALLGGQRGLAEDSARIAGVVFTATQRDRAVVPGAHVRLTTADSVRETLTDARGEFIFVDVTPGSYSVEATATGLRGSVTAVISLDRVLNADIEMKPTALSESVNVTSEAPPGLNSDSSTNQELDRNTVVNAPNINERVDSLLPLIPGVLRGPDGLINIKGARSSQSGYLINNASGADPVTGNPAVTLPLDVVQSVSVLANPYHPEYGRLTGGVASIETMTGNFNAFRFTMQNLVPRLRRRDGDILGLEASTPRITLTGPLVRNRVAFTQSFEYRFVRTPVSSLPPTRRDTKIESFNSFTQVDINLTPHQTMSVSLAFFPQKYNYLGLNAFTPQESTPDLHQRGYMVSLQHHLALSANSMITSEFSYKRFDVEVTPNSADPYRLTIETTQGGFFDRQQRDSNRVESRETWQKEVHELMGSHEFKVGAEFSRNTYSGVVEMLPVSILGTADLPIENISFGAAARFGVHDNEVSWFAGDRWSPFQRLTLDLGLRFDWDNLARTINTAPRFGFAVSLTKDARTVLKGGVGLFYDRIPLNVAAFPLLPDRTVTVLDGAAGGNQTTVYANRFSGPMLDPRSLGWNIELDRQISSRLIVRAGYLERNTVHTFVLDPSPPDGGNGLLSLASTGHSFYREFQLTGQYEFRKGNLNVSYVRSKAFGDLNDFNQFFGNNPSAVIQPDFRVRQPFDAPNRVLFRGVFRAPFKLTVSPVLDVHTGFPYSVVNEYRQFIGPPDSRRFPRFASLDLQVTRPLTLRLGDRKLHMRVGVSVFNLLNRFNPRDVQSDVDSLRYGALFDGVGRTLRGKFIFEF